MKIQINAVHFNADNSLVDFIQKKLNKLETFYDRIISGEVFLKLDKGEKSSIQKKLIEIKLQVPGSSIFIKESGTSFEEATDLAMDSLTRQIKKYKEKNNIISHVKPEPALVEEADLDDF
jgi:putative sigma-54 modulation protein